MKKVLVLFALIFTLFVLSGCNKGKNFVEINGGDIFNQEGNYYIFFYTNDSEESEQVKPVIESYMKAIKEDHKYKDKNKSLIYAVNLSKDNNSEILREYAGEFGQGDLGDFKVDDVTKWDDLYIPTTPSLISVKTNSQNVTYAAYEAAGAQGIYTFLAEYLDN